MERKRFGDYSFFLHEPETEAEKADYIKVSVSMILDEMIELGVIPDWNTIQLIVKEGFGPIPTNEWTEEEVKVTVGWHMTVGLKFESENYRMDEGGNT